ncbi:hypothetical protein DFH07DRAFT_935942 [Mycena maculata]|uniref:Uncharacterized protein n=1 Tax=Mycena maculata TaxID=230809 RepID=A0AAD7K8M8_9AGAR|nr:hypothetical protein DFH07DRAFT_935942 [Mycena maculata]
MYKELVGPSSQACKIIKDISCKTISSAASQMPHAPALSTKIKNTLTLFARNPFSYNPFEQGQSSDTVIHLNEQAAATYQELMSSPYQPTSSPFLLNPISDTSFSSLSSSSPYPLNLVSDTSYESSFSPTGYFPNLQSTQDHPQQASHSMSGTSSSFNLAPAFASPHGSADDIETASNPEGTSDSHFIPFQPPLFREPVQFEQPLTPEQPARAKQIPSRIPTPGAALPIVPGRGSMADLRMRRALTPASNVAAVYLGFPFHENYAHRNFFERAVSLPSPNPSLSDLIRALRSVGGGWSRQMVEVHDPTWSASAHGHREVQGGLRDHLNGSPVIVSPTTHNAMSCSSFGHQDLDLCTPLFVLYIFPVDIPAPIAPNVSQPLTEAAARADRRSRSRTPVNPQPGPGSSTSSFLANLLKMSTALDSRYLQDGHSLAALLSINNKSNLQIHQALIIESYLRAHANSRTQSADNQQKEKELRDFLSACFSEELATEDSSSSSAPTALTVSGTTVKTLKTKMDPFTHLSMPYKNQRFTKLNWFAFIASSHGNKA